MAETPKKKTTTRKAPVKAKTSTPRAPRRTAKAIRNLRGTVVHARLYSKNPKDPFRIALNPRGQHGDATVVPVELIDDPTFLAGIDVLFEVIPQTEFKNLRYSQPVGYQQRTDAPRVERPQDTTVTSAPDWDGKGRLPQDREVTRVERGSDAPVREFGTGMHTTDVPGSDHALHAQLKAGAEALPADVDLSSRRVVVERTRG